MVSLSVVEDLLQLSGNASMEFILQVLSSI
jgi:hypothetical protein